MPVRAGRERALRSDKSPTRSREALYQSNETSAKSRDRYGLPSSNVPRLCDEKYARGIKDKCGRKD